MDTSPDSSWCPLAKNRWARLSKELGRREVATERGWPEQPPLQTFPVATSKAANSFVVPWLNPQLTVVPFDDEQAICSKQSVGRDASYTTLFSFH